ncbi:MAG TPA: efflux RND transporter periplasmic adaptor subunit [Longimicrobiales bacterium]|nr:efflux RND transporter periplasmic adaptor subunit [Longimicrobiales bacterium]
MSGKTIGSRIRIYAIGLVVISGGVVAVVSGRTRAEAAAPQEAPAVTVGQESIHVVGSGAVSTGPVISGSLQPERKATVRAEVAGAVLSTSVDVGQTVRQGQVVARIDDLAIRAGFESAQSAVRAADGAALVARRNVQRMETLVGEGAVAERAVEDARTAALAAERQLADARAALAQAETLLSKTVLRAPISGVVAERSANAGDVVQPGMALLTVVDPSSMQLEASVPSEQLASVRVGAPVEFRVNGYAQSFTGTVDRVSPVADPVTRQVRVFISIPNAQNRLVGGLFAEGRIQAETRAGLTAPATAVQTIAGATDGRSEVLRIRGGVVELVEVVTGLRDVESETIEIASGVGAGDTLLIGAARTVMPGTPVVVAAGRAAAAAAVSPARAGPASTSSAAARH